MIMIELEALNWSFQLLLYIYDMISGMSRADVKNVPLIMHTDSTIPSQNRRQNRLLLTCVLVTVIYKQRAKS